jgi:hypothetical protein
MLDMKAVFEALLPKGSLWEPAPLLGFDQFLTALGKNANDVYEQLYALGNLRDPRTTPVLSDLEKEYGILPKTNLSEAVRRQQLAAIKYARPGTASDTDLQTILRNAGFDVYVTRNFPPVDPADILATEYLLEAGEVDAFAGEPNAIAGLGGGELLVNGPIVKTSIDYEAQANGAAMFADEPTAIAGYFTGVTYTTATYSIPVLPDTWSYIFFVSGEVERGFGDLYDLNFEYATMTQWPVGDVPQGSILVPSQGPDYTLAQKHTNPTRIYQGIRGAYVEYLPGAPLGYALGSAFLYGIGQTFDPPITESVTVSVKAWGDGSAGVAPYIWYLNPVTNNWNSAAGVAGTTTQQTISFTFSAGIAAIALGPDGGSATAGNYAYFDDLKIELDTPMQRAEIPSEREREFKELILKYKPLGTWAGMLVDYI